MHSAHTPCLYVIAGPSAVGKGTIVKELLRHYPHIYLSVSVTTRSPREGEVHGRDYFFVSDACFDDMLRHGDLLEWAQVHGHHRYGTPRQCVLEAIEHGQPALLEIDVAGAFQVKASMPHARMIFIEPPSWEELTRRLIGRGSENTEQQQRRLATAREELSQAERFDTRIVNDTLEKAVTEVAVFMGVDVR